MMMAYLALAAMVTPALHLWVSKRARQLYGLVAGCATVALVTVFQDNTETLVVVSSLNGLALLYAMWCHRLDRYAVLLVMALGAGAAVCRILSRDAYPSTRYDILHSCWHLLGGLAALVVALALHQSTRPPATKPPLPNIKTRSVLSPLSVRTPITYTSVPIDKP
jgi:hypothetical protein